MARRRSSAGAAGRSGFFGLVCSKLLNNQAIPSKEIQQKPMKSKGNPKNSKGDPKKHKEFHETPNLRRRRRGCAWAPGADKYTDGKPYSLGRSVGPMAGAVQTAQVPSPMSTPAFSEPASTAQLHLP